MTRFQTLSHWPAVLALLASCSIAHAEAGFTSLYDGKTLNGWVLLKGEGPGYVPKEGILECPKDGGGDLVTEKEYADFVFRFEFKLNHGSNNGVGIRTPLVGNLTYTGMEIQILDD